jgi:hypothetical protein
MVRRDDDHDGRRARERPRSLVRVALRAAASAAPALLVASAAAADPDARLAPHLYDLTIETGMPHLDENLRYATAHERRCVRGDDLPRLFPVLQHVALQDCRLAAVDSSAEGATYALRCTGGHGTTGEARFVFAPAAIAGTLSVQLGGKNMTFHQRIAGRALGPCEEARGAGDVVQGPP